MAWNSEQLCSRADIIDTHYRYAQGIDRRDWVLYRSVFADRARFDFTSWYGGEAVELASDEWVERVAARQTGFDSTQHQMSNPVVSLAGDSAECSIYVIARHCLRDGSRDRIQAIGGYYSNQLRLIGGAWKITQCKLNVEWTQGDRALFSEAAERLRARSGGSASPAFQVPS